MRCLVTGAGGQVGSEIVEQGKLRGYTIIATDRTSLDITDAEATKAIMLIEEPDVVINAAAYTAVDKAETDIVQAYAINQQGPYNLASACSERHIPLLHISTDYIFDGDKSSPYTENDSPNPRGVYGASKLAGERSIAKVLCCHYIIRVAWVFGSTGNNFVRTILRLAQKTSELTVVADQRGNPTWARDIAMTLLDIADKQFKGRPIPYGTYHYVSKESASWFSFANATIEEAKKQSMLSNEPIVTSIATSEFPTPAIRPKNSTLNCDKITSALDIVQPDWHAALKNVVAAWRQL